MIELKTFIFIVFSKISSIDIIYKEFIAAVFLISADSSAGVLNFNALVGQISTHAGNFPVFTLSKHKSHLVMAFSSCSFL